MNKLVLLLLSLALFACAKSPDLRPDVYARGERLLSSGVLEYKNENYTGAQQKFYRALMLYQSIDSSKGTQLARVNLVESLLAINDFAAAEVQLTILKQEKKNGVINGLLNDRIVMLEVKLLFQKQQYREALVVIEPLLLQMEQQEIKANKRLELLATAARLEALVSDETESQRISKFREALLLERTGQTKYQIILKRIDAINAMQNQQYDEALILLHEALDYYKDQTDRRAIAACLEDIAEIELKLDNQEQALNYLERALAIRTWLKDQYHIDKIQQLISDN